MDLETGQIGAAVIGLDAARDQSAKAVPRDLRRKSDWLASLPTMLTKEIGDTAHGVDRARRQVAFAISIEVHGIAPIAAGHELRNAYGAGIGPFQSKDIDGFLPGMQEVLFQFSAKINGARRVIESESRERFDDAICPYVASVDGFDTDYGDDYLFRDAVIFGGALQGLLVPLMKLHARFDTCGIDESGAVGLPRALRRLCRRYHGPQHARLGLYF